MGHKKPTAKTPSRLPGDSQAAVRARHPDFTLQEESKDFTRWLSKDIAVLDYFAGVPEKVPRELWIPLETLRVKKGRKFYSELLFALTHKFFEPDYATILWNFIVRHKKGLVKKLNREISMKVAVLDYLDNQTDRQEDLQLFPGDEVDNLVIYANEDGLTTLFNHRYFYERLQYEIQRTTRYHHPLSLFFIDLDYFKKYNDAFGHLKGDALIRDVALFLRTNCRMTDIVARYGGDEFAVVLPETNAKQALILAKRLQEKMKKFRSKYPRQNKRSFVSMSLGISSFPEEGHDGDVLIAAADRALYRAKRSGRNCICAQKRVIRTRSTRARASS